MVGGESRHVATQKAIAACGEKYSHTVKGEFTGFDGYLEKLTTQMAGKTEADIVQVNWPWLPLFSKNGEGFADLRQLKPLDLFAMGRDGSGSGFYERGASGPFSLHHRPRVFQRHHLREGWR